MTWQILAWIGEHQGQLLALLVFLMAATWIISAAVYALWLRHEADGEERQRQRLEALIELSNKAHRDSHHAPGHPRKRVG